MKKAPSLPPGQKELDHYPRFGLWQFATRIDRVNPISIELIGDSAKRERLDAASFSGLPRTEQTSDIHCVTTWSRRRLRWSGYRFRDFYEELARHRLQMTKPPKFVRFASEDGYRTYMYFDDLLADDVLLADRLDGEPLGLDHGGAMRLVAPAHYGFKSAKHLCRIHFCDDLKGYRSPALHWHEHPRARVALEERGILLPTWFWRWIGPPAIPTVLYWYRRAARTAFKRNESR